MSRCHLPRVVYHQAYNVYEEYFKPKAEIREGGKEMERLERELRTEKAGAEENRRLKEVMIHKVYEP